jgi:hypothetical protein
MLLRHPLASSHLLEKAPSPHAANDGEGPAHFMYARNMDDRICLGLLSSVLDIQLFSSLVWLFGVALSLSLSFMP